MPHLSTGNEVSEEQYGRELKEKLAAVNRRLAYYNRNPFDVSPIVDSIPQIHEAIAKEAEKRRLQRESENNARKFLASQAVGPLEMELKDIQKLPALTRRSRYTLLYGRKMMYARYINFQIEKEKLANDGFCDRIIPHHLLSPIPNNNNSAPQHGVNRKSLTTSSVASLDSSGSNSLLYSSSGKGKLNNTSSVIINNNNSSNNNNSMPLSSSSFAVYTSQRAQPSSLQDILLAHQAEATAALGGGAPGTATGGERVGGGSGGGGGGVGKLGSLFGIGVGGGGGGGNGGGGSSGLGMLLGGMDLLSVRSDLMSTTSNGGKNLWSTAGTNRRKMASREDSGDKSHSSPFGHAVPVPPTPKGEKEGKGSFQQEKSSSGAHHPHPPSHQPPNTYSLRRLGSRQNSLASIAESVSGSNPRVARMQLPPVSEIR